MLCNGLSVCHLDSFDFIDATLFLLFDAVFVRPLYIACEISLVSADFEIAKSINKFTA